MEPRSLSTRDTIDQAGERRSARIESLRALGAITVVAFHVAVLRPNGLPLAARVARGWTVGLPIFFFISAFLLFRPFIAKRMAAGQSVDLKRFAFNRIVRIVPLYYIALLVLFVAQEHRATLKQVLLFATATQSYSLSTRRAVDEPLWTVGVELQFYALLPLLALLVPRGARLRTVAAILLALGAASWALRLLIVTPGGFAVRPGHDPRLAAILPVNFCLFVPGMLLAAASVAWSRGRPAWLRGLAASSTAWLVVAAAMVALLSGTPEGTELLYAIVPFLVIGSISLALADGLPARLLGWRPLATLGMASYSVYVWHVPILLAFLGHGLLPPSFFPAAALVIPTTCVAGLLSYRIIEEPFLRLRGRWATAVLGSVPSEEPSRESHVQRRDAPATSSGPASEVAEMDVPLTGP